MAVYSVEGKLGTGKTKFAVWQAQLALACGRRVASNVDLHLQHLAPRRPRASYVRLPDKPTALDLAAMGHGNPDSYDEDRNGVLILDELGTWLNSRSFQDKGRADLLDWLIHARKLGWDVYLIVQSSMMIDKQVREALVEYQARCMRLDKVKIPLVGGVLNDLFGGRAGYLPRMHFVAARVGAVGSQIVAERWMYRGDHLHSCYDTRQVFRADYPHGAHSVLHPHYFAGPAQPASWRSRLLAGIGLRPGTRQRVGRRPIPAKFEHLANLSPDERWRLARELAMAGS